MRARLVQLAGQEKAGVAKAQTAAARLSALNAAETQLKGKVGANQQSLTRLLGALQNYQRDPPPALLVSPRSARDAVNAAILMRAVTPELQHRAKAFAEEGKRLNALRREILIADGDFLGAEHDVADRRAEMDALDEEKARLEDKLDPARAGQAEAAHRIGTTAGSVDELVKGVTNPNDATAAAATLAPLRLTSPVDGAPIRRFGQDFPGHGPSQGWSWTAPEGALVISPAAGRVVYAGPLKGWGFVVILRSPGGYHLVLAGLERVSARVGGEVAAGEPVGRIARTPAANPGKATMAPELYLEIRKASQPVDPARFFAGRAGR
ncbi:MAG: peptidoglycan DD-metalloendopeptidase family protein [Pseudomonadota bacterium]|nr:peptidoglycan DD-metalloendopeptidase family protein [Pseudomonadota bacterium]